MSTQDVIKKTVYEMYYEYSEPIHKIPSGVSRARAVYFRGL